MCYVVVFADFCCITFYVICIINYYYWSWSYKYSLLARIMIVLDMIKPIKSQNPTKQTKKINNPRSTISPGEVEDGAPKRAVLARVGQADPATPWMFRQCSEIFRNFSRGFPHETKTYGPGNVGRSLGVWDLFSGPCMVNGLMNGPYHMTPSWWWPWTRETGPELGTPAAEQVRLMSFNDQYIL